MAGLRPTQRSLATVSSCIATSPRLRRKTETADCSATVVGEGTVNAIKPGAVLARRRSCEAPCENLGDSPWPRRWVRRSASASPSARRESVTSCRPRSTNAPARESRRSRCRTGGSPGCSPPACLNDLDPRRHFPPACRRSKSWPLFDRADLAGRDWTSADFHEGGAMGGSSQFVPHQADDEAVPSSPAQGRRATQHAPPECPVRSRPT